MQAVTTIGLDIAKSVFQVHGIDAEGKVIIRRKLKRRYVAAFFQKLPSTEPPWKSGSVVGQRTFTDNRRPDLTQMEMTKAPEAVDPGAVDHVLVWARTGL